MKYLAFRESLYLQIGDRDQKVSKKLVMELHEDIQILQIYAIFLVTKLCLDMVITKRYCQRYNSGFFFDVLL